MAEIAASADARQGCGPVTHTVGGPWKYSGRLAATKALVAWSRWDRRAGGSALVARGPAGRTERRVILKPRPHSPAPRVQLGRPVGQGIGGDVVIRAPIAGIVVKLLVGVGDLVADGDDVIVVNAMKMENLLPAPVDGRVKEIAVEPGAGVMKGQALLVIEEAPA